MLAGWESDPGFLVTAATGDHRSLLPGVWAASERFYCIGENGVELDVDELGLTDIYTPNFVYAPRVRTDGVALFADAKGFTSRAMGETMVQVLVEELRSLDFDTHIGVLGEPETWIRLGDAAPEPDN